MLVASPALLADLVEMQNGDRYAGKVLSMSATAVILESEILGKISVPRAKVASVAFGTNTVTPVAVTPVARAAAATNRPTAAPLIVIGKTNVDLSAALRHPGTDTNFIQQIRKQMLAGSPEAGEKYDELVGGLLSGQINLNDLRREAQSSADQLRELKREAGPDVGDSLDGYLEVLDGFLKEAASEPANASPVH